MGADGAVSTRGDSSSIIGDPHHDGIAVHLEIELTDFAAECFRIFMKAS